VIYFYREFRSEVLSDPMGFTHADLEARELSRTNASGLSEMVTYQDGVLFVVATYLRGKKRYQGLKANQAARNNLPPTA
jgi:hypothetical protein